MPLLPPWNGTVYLEQMQDKPVSVVLLILFPSAWLGDPGLHSIHILMDHVPRLSL